MVVGGEEGFSENSLLQLCQYYSSRYADDEDTDLATGREEGPSRETRGKTSGGTGFQHTDSSDKRGVTLMKKIDRMRAKGKTLQVEFDDDGHALGKNGSTFRSYLGVLARSKVPITIDKWKHVPADIKDRIWDDILVVFKGVENRRRQEMKNVGMMWRNFKTHLTNRYITKKTAPEDEDPLQKYPFLTEEVWQEFLAVRQTPEFQAHSELQRQRQSGNRFPHTMSRRGYAMVDEMIRKEQGDDPKTPGDGDGASATSISIPRHVKWMRGRIDRKTGKFKTPTMEEVAQKIDELEERAAQGSFTPFGKRDILTEALGTDEHPGRVRGVGGDVGLKKVFPQDKRRRIFSSQEELDHCIKQRVKEEVMNALAQFGFKPTMLPSTSVHPSAEVELNQTRQAHPSASGHPSGEVELNKTSQAQPSTSGHLSVEAELNATPRAQPTVLPSTSEDPSVEVELNQTPHAQPTVLPSTSSRRSTKVVFKLKSQAQPTVLPSTSDHPSAEVEVNQTPRTQFNPRKRNRQAPDPFQEIPEGGLKCVLKVDEDGKQRVVAFGKVLKGSMHHCAPLPHDQVQVIIENFVDPNANVPVPTDEVQTVMDALKGFISWPKSLIDLNVEGYDQPHSKYKSEQPKDKLKEVVDSGNKEGSTLESKKIASVKLSSLPKTCKRLYSYAKLMTSEGSIMIPMGQALLGIEYSLCMTKENILQFLRMAALNVSCMELYIRCLAGMCSELDIESTYGFLHPNIMAAGNEVSTRASYMSNKMRADSKPCFFTPYIDASSDVEHWMLCVIYPKDNRVYWLDPSGKKVCKDLREAIDSGLKDYRLSSGARNSRARSRTEWIKVKCPIQTGDTLCGYYVMRYMKDIIFLQMNANVARFQQCFRQSHVYSQEQIDEVREQWADYLLDCISSLQHDLDDEEV